MLPAIGTMGRAVSGTVEFGFSTSGIGSRKFPSLWSRIRHGVDDRSNLPALVWLELSFPASKADFGRRGRQMERVVSRKADTDIEIERSMVRSAQGFRVKERLTFNSFFSPWPQT